MQLFLVIVLGIVYLFLPETLGNHHKGFGRGGNVGGGGVGNVHVKKWGYPSGPVCRFGCLSIFRPGGKGKRGPKSIIGHLFRAIGKVIIKPGKTKPSKPVKPAKPDKPKKPGKPGKPDKPGGRPGKKPSKDKDQFDVDFEIGGDDDYDY